MGRRKRKISKESISKKIKMIVVDPHKKHREDFKTKFLGKILWWPYTPEIWIRVKVLEVKETTAFENTRVKIIHDPKYLENLKYSKVINKIGKTVDLTPEMRGKSIWVNYVSLKTKDKLLKILEKDKEIIESNLRAVKSLKKMHESTLEHINHVMEKISQ